MGEFVTGPYTATYNAKALGQTAGGYTLSHEFNERAIRGDLQGDAVQDTIYRGRDQFLEFELIEALAAGIADLIDPWATVVGTPLTMGIVGQLAVGWAVGCAGNALPIVLTAVAGGCQDPATMTLPLTMLAAGYPVRTLMSSDLRSISIRQRIYPNATTGVFGTVT